MTAGRCMKFGESARCMMAERMVQCKSGCYGELSYDRATGYSRSRGDSGRIDVGGEKKMKKNIRVLECTK